jgi:hypothetical protein
MAAEPTGPHAPVLRIVEDVEERTRKLICRCGSSSLFRPLLTAGRVRLG